VRRIRVVAVSSVFVLSAATGAILTHRGEHSSAADQRKLASSEAVAGANFRNSLEIGTGDTPFGPGERAVGLQRAQQESPFHLYRPKDSLASDSSLTGAWENSWFTRGDTSAEIALWYGSGIQVYVESWTFNQEPVSFYESLQVVDNIPGQIESINGWPALVVPENDHGPAFIELDIHGVAVQIDGVSGITAQQLIEVAQTLQ
jgi:hypothetical protein